MIHHVEHADLVRTAYVPPLRPTVGGAARARFPRLMTVAQVIDARDAVPDMPLSRRRALYGEAATTSFKSWQRQGGCQVVRVEEATNGCVFALAVTR